MKLLLLYRRRWWLLYLPIVLLLGLLLALVARVWDPLPPSRIVIGTGPAQSSYLQLARAYANRLEHLGLAVDIVTHPRPQDPLIRMVAGDPSIDITFAQGLYAPQGTGVHALSVVGHEIIWVVARRNIEHIEQLRGKRIATSVDDSSNRLAMNLLLAHLRIKEDEVTLTSQVGDAAIAALAEGEVDAVVHVATGDSQTANALARMDNMHILGIERAGALAAREPHLRAVIMPQGSIELRSNLPASDLPTMVTLTHLLVRPDLHPAVQRALLDVAGELHVMAGFLERQGVYPTTLGSDFAVSPTAQRYAQGQRPLMETLLPFRKAQWTQLWLFAVLPIAVLGSLLLWRAPRYIEWRVDAALQHFYGELKFLEQDMSSITSTDPAALRAALSRLDLLERQVANMELPDRFADRWYTLREHLQHARHRLMALRSAGA
ncbi:ABC transporter substrate-binding protein [Hydrogenophaga sp.]|uniref:ABC transporter substrate-binding protein n=1 Tax=Hydrogenophaga sp. TaxID=1904254 RepID=UPI0027290531|nr:ABC transporter substrate-binding protein [Hydrogenophaga sp.]MDO8903695.1 ABC transporter substrate-binding protein [Hydrogenophaga sp.]